MEPEVAEAARGEAAFSIRALQHLAFAAGAGASSKNLAVSPVSIHAAVVLLGAAARGATLDEIVAFLGPAGGRAHALLASDVALRVLANSAGDHGGPKVRFANSVWVDDASARLKADYAHVVAEQFRAQAYAASFTTKPEKARRDIDRWVQAATAGRIKGFLPQGSVGAGTRAILANALYFKGVWESKFDARLTQPHRFYLLNGGHVRVPFMSSRESQHIACCPEWKVLKLLYASGRRGGEHQRRQFAMYVYLPNERHGLPSMLRKLASSPELLEAGSMDLRDMVPVRDFVLPKFTVSYKTEATGFLQGLGLRLPFGHDAADFSEMLEESKGSLVVSNVYHQSLVEVNEEGTEAAATTAVTSMTFTCPAVMSTPVKYVDFVADHPFMFLIKEELTGVIVFAGQVVDPSS